MLRYKRLAVGRCEISIKEHAVGAVNDRLFWFEFNENKGKYHAGFRKFCEALRLEFDRAVRAAAKRMRKRLLRRKPCPASPRPTRPGT
jgi:hypothetical protein